MVTWADGVLGYQWPQFYSKSSQIFFSWATFKLFTRKKNQYGNFSYGTWDIAILPPPWRPVGVWKWFDDQRRIERDIKSKMEIDKQSGKEGRSLKGLLEGRRNLLPGRLALLHAVGLAWARPADLSWAGLARPLLPPPLADFLHLIYAVWST